MRHSDKERKNVAESRPGSNTEVIFASLNKCVLRCDLKE